MSDTNWIKLVLKIKKKKEGLEDGLTLSIPYKITVDELEEHQTINMKFDEMVKKAYAKLEEEVGHEKQWDERNTKLEEYNL